MTPEDELEVEEAYFRTLALPAGFHAQGRAVLLRLRLSERVPRARLGLRRPAARLPGVLRRPARAGRRAAQVDRADGSLSRAGRRVGQRRRASPGRAATANGLNGTTLFAHVGSDLGESVSWRAGASWLDLRAAGSRLGGRRCARQRGRERVQRDVADLDCSMRRSSGRRRATRCAATSKLQAEYMRPHRGRRARLRSSRAARSPERYRSRAGRLVRAGGLPVPPALARRAHATTRSIPARRTSGSSPRRAHRRAISRCSLPAQPSRTLADARLEPERVLAAAGPVRLGRCARRRRPTSSSFCSTSTRWAPTAPTSSEEHRIMDTA